MTNINLKEINKSTKLTLEEVTTYVMRDETPEDEEGNEESQTEKEIKADIFTFVPSPGFEKPFIFYLTEKRNFGIDSGYYIIPCYVPEE
ncbi:MAG: hypothetical protein ACXU93_12015 [Thermodesulfobacteriota bacterium]